MLIPCLSAVNGFEKRLQDCIRPGGVQRQLTQHVTRGYANKCRVAASKKQGRMSTWTSADVKAETSVMMIDRLLSCWI